MEAIYIKGGLFNWFVQFSVSSLTMAVLPLERLKAWKLPVCKTGSLSSPNLVLKAFRTLREPLVFSPC